MKITGHGGGFGRTKHREFAMASGEFTTFLTTAFRNMVDVSTDGSIRFLCMDCRHLGEMLATGQGVHSDLKKNLIVWAKVYSGMGTFYRSRHELIFAFQVGTAPHVNTFELGQHERYRTNLWQYRSVKTMRAGRIKELVLHPTVMPVQIIADAIRDISGRGGEDRAARIPRRTRPDLLRPHSRSMGGSCKG